MSRSQAEWIIDGFWREWDERGGARNRERISLIDVEDLARFEPTVYQAFKMRDRGTVSNEDALCMCVVYLARQNWQLTKRVVKLETMKPLGEIVEIGEVKE